MPSLFGSQFPGVVVMGAAILIMFFLPWLDRSPVKSMRYRGILFKLVLAAFVISFIVLAIWAVADHPERDPVAQIFSALYFGFFLLLPICRRLKRPSPFRKG